MTKDEARAALEGRNLTHVAAASGVGRRTLVRIRQNADPDAIVEPYTLLRLARALKRMDKRKEMSQ